MTPLAAKLAEKIRREGPLSVKEYVTACLYDEEHGYYRTQAAIGAAGDFVTAPEISQVFGELIGLWCAVVWQSMGSPPRLDLVELGPGRGTMMRDALRATRIVPGFHDAIAVRLVESNAALIPLQRAALEEAHSTLHAAAHWHERAESCCDALAAGAAPFILLANEFLDTCPAEQYVLHGGQIVQRGVGVDAAGALAFAVFAPRSPPPSAAARDMRGEGDCVEVQDFGFFDPYARLMSDQAAAALFIDYGSDVTRASETLQAVRDHRAETPLLAPGEADLSFQVDFARFKSIALDVAGLAVDGPVPQAEFLGRLGVVERASRLMAANPVKAGAIEGQVQRLMAPTGMGSRFLALGVRSQGLPPLPGLA